MNKDRSHLINPADRLPDLHLPTPAGDLAELLRLDRSSSLRLIFTHGESCAQCATYVNRLTGETEELAGWGACIVVMAHDNGGGPFDSGIIVLVDAEDQLARTLDLAAPFVLVADQWGEIRERFNAGGAHGFPEPAELVSWARYLATQCPECEGEAL